MNQTKAFSLTCASMALATSLLGQAIIFEDDFSVSEANGNPNTAVWRMVGETADKTIKVTEQGWLHYRKVDADGGLYITAENRFSAGHTVITLEFDFLKPSLTSWDAPNGLGPRIRFGQGNPFINANRVANDNRFDQNGQFAGVAGVFETDEWQSMRIVYNHSTSEVTYVGSSLTVPAQTYDVWVNGVRVIAGHTYNTFATGLAPDSPLTSIAFGGFNNETGELFMDNMVVYANAIPEPSTYALIGGLAVLGAAIFWRRRRS